MDRVRVLMKVLPVDDSTRFKFWKEKIFVLFSGNIDQLSCCDDYLLFEESFVWPGTVM